MLAGGIGITINALLRSLIGYIDINISRIWIVFMLLIGLVAVITLRLSIRKKLDHPTFDKKGRQKVISIPSFKNMILVVFCYFMMLFFSIAPFQMTFEEKKNISGYILWVSVLYIFTTLNMASITDRKVHAKIKNIRG